MQNQKFDDDNGIFQSMLPDPDDEARADTIAELAHYLKHAGPDHDQVAFRLDMALLLLERHALRKNAKQLEDEEFRLLASALAVRAPAPLISRRPV